MSTFKLGPKFFLSCSTSTLVKTFMFLSFAVLSAVFKFSNLIFNFFNNFLDLKEKTKFLIYEEFDMKFLSKSFVGSEVISGISIMISI